MSANNAYPCIVCGQRGSGSHCLLCNQAHYCSAECLATDSIHELLCIGRHPLEERPSPDAIRGVFFASGVDAPRFIWISSSSYGATIARIESLIGSTFQSYSFDINPVRNRAIDGVIRCFHSAPHVVLQPNQVVAAVLSKCKQWNGANAADTSNSWVGHLMFLGDNRDLTYQDFRHIADYLSIKRTGGVYDRALWTERARKIQGVQLSWVNDAPSYLPIYYPQDHPYFIDATTRPKAPGISILKYLRLLYIVEETPGYGLDSGFRHGAIRTIAQSLPEMFAVRRLLIRDTMSFQHNLDLKFVRTDGKNLRTEHVNALCNFIGEIIEPLMGGENRSPLDVAAVVLEFGTRERFFEYWSDEFMLRIPEAPIPSLEVPQPYHDIELDDVTNGTRTLVVPLGD